MKQFVILFLISVAPVSFAGSTNLLVDFYMCKDTMDASKGHSLTPTLTAEFIVDEAKQSVSKITTFYVDGKESGKRMDALEDCKVLSANRWQCGGRTKTMFGSLVTTEFHQNLDGFFDYKVDSTFASYKCQPIHKVRSG